MIKKSMYRVKKKGIGKNGNDNKFLRCKVAFK